MPLNLERGVLWIVCLACGLHLQASSPGARAHELRIAIEECDKAREKVDLLHRLASIYLDHFYDIPRADSAYLAAIQWAESSNERDLKIKAYTQFLESLELGRSDAIVRDVVSRLSGISLSDRPLEVQFEAYATLCRACDVMGDECSELYADKAILLANGQMDKVLIVKANLIKGNCAINNFNVELAYRYISKAEVLLLDLKQKDRPDLEDKIRESYSRLYSLIGDHDLAMQYNLLRQTALIESLSIDTTKLYWLKREELEHAYKKVKTHPIKPGVDEILKYAKRHQLRKLQENVLAMYRSYLIQNENYKGLRDFYVVQQPEELDALKGRSTYHYYTICAYIQEADGAIDSSGFYWQKAIAEASAMGNPYQQAHAHYRFGQFYMRQDRDSTAVFHFSKAIELTSDYSITGHRNDFLRDVYKMLDVAYEKLGDYKMARECQYKYLALEREMQGVISKELFTLQGNHQSTLEARKSELKEYEKKRRHNLQYWIISFLLVILITSLILASSMRVPRWIVEMLAFFSVLAIVEFVLLLLDKQVVYITGGNPLGKFFIKVAILSIVFPLHHIIEHRVKEYMLKHKLIGRIRGRDVKGAMASLWPWLRDEQKEDK